MNRKALIAAAAVALVAGFLFLRSGGPGWPLMNWPPSGGSTIVVLGDSLTSGHSVNPGESYVDRLEQRFGVSIVNAGISGNVTADGLKRLDRDVLSEDPRIVLVFLGGNDMLRKTAPESQFRDLREIVRRIQATGAFVILVGLEAPPLMSSTDYGDLYEEVAREMGTGYVPNAMGGVFGRPSLMADSIHPNAAGHEKMAKRIGDAIEEYM